LKPVLDYYENICKKAHSDLKSAAILKKMVTVVPDIKQLRQGIRHRKEKEHIVYKIVLDVLAHYLREFEQISDNVHFYYNNSVLELL
jgi:hypothetical protein